jgi:mRNA-degrading endonuclease HigB of HigAB toxin-antitoxin module
MSKHTPPRAYFHVHHEQMWEWATEPMENRIEYIKKEKPTSEIDTRLRLLKEIPYERIKSLVDTKGQYDAVQRTAWEQYEAVERPAWEQYDAVQRTAWEQYKAVVRTAWEQYKAVERSAREQYDAVQRTAWEQYEAVQRTFDMEALHRELCPDCPWDGRTIFP